MAIKWGVKVLLAGKEDLQQILMAQRRVAFKRVAKESDEITNDLFILLFGFLKHWLCVHSFNWLEANNRILCSLSWSTKLDIWNPVLRKFLSLSFICIWKACGDFAATRSHLTKTYYKTTDERPISHFPSIIYLNQCNTLITTT